MTRIDFLRPAAVAFMLCAAAPASAATVVLAPGTTAAVSVQDLEVGGVLWDVVVAGDLTAVEVAQIFAFPGAAAAQEAAGALSAALNAAGATLVSRPNPDGTPGTGRIADTFHTLSNGEIFGARSIFSTVQGMWVVGSIQLEHVDTVFPFTAIWTEAQAEVPLPPAAALLLGGLGLTGAALRRRRG